MNCFSIWTGKPAGNTSTISTAYFPSYTAPQTINVSNATTWPTRGFWVRNKTKNDIRYVDFRSGNSLYTKAIDWGILSFKTGTIEIKPGMMLGNSATPSTTAVVDQVILSSGSWANGDAAGVLHLKKYTGSNGFSVTGTIYLGNQAAATGNGTSTRGFRGYNAQTWLNNDVIEPTSDIDIGVNLPIGGYFRDPVDEKTAPEGIPFGLYPSQDECLIVESLLGSESVGIWIRPTILDGTQAREDIDGSILLAWF
jgi:hypothetical protein